MSCLLLVWTHLFMNLSHFLIRPLFNIFGRTLGKLVGVYCKMIKTILIKKYLYKTFICFASDHLVIAGFPVTTVSELRDFFYYYYYFQSQHLSLQVSQRDLQQNLVNGQIP